MASNEPTNTNNGWSGYPWASGPAEDELKKRLQQYEEKKGNVEKIIEVIREAINNLPNMLENSSNKEKSAKLKEIPFAIKPTKPDSRTENQVIHYIMKSIDKKKIKVNISYDWQTREDHVPLIVFCDNASRIGVDVEYALRGVQDPQVVLIILHYCRRSLLKGDLSDTDYLLPDELRKRVGHIAHFAFDDEEAYDCQQNRDARTKLCNRLKESVLDKL